MKTILKHNRIIRICLAAVIFVSVLTASVLALLDGPGGLGLVTKSWGYFKTYTVESNILMAAVCALLLFCLIFRKGRIPEWLYALQLTGASVTAVTFVTVLLFLTPSTVAKGGSPWKMYADEMLFLHFLNPLFAFILTGVLPDEHRYTRKECLIAVIPTVLYSFVYAYNVLVTGAWKDFYGFTFGGRYWLSPLVVAALYALGYFAAALIKKVHEKTACSV